MSDKSRASKCIHAGEENKRFANSVTVPVFNTTTYEFKNLKELKRYVNGDRSLYLYSRYSNPTVEAVENKLADLERGEAGMVCSSGMGAISTTLLALLHKGDHLVSTPILYGGAFSFISIIMKNAGLEYSFAENSSIDSIRKSITPNTKVIYTETPTNPNLAIVDLEAVGKLAQETGCLLVVDSTFGTPINQNPIELGADIVIHSGSKYLSGHSDLLCGAVISSEQIIGKLKEYRKFLGTVLDPQAAFLFNRGLKTLDVRMERHNQNGLKVAEYLESHPKVSKVRYPGLKSSPFYEIANKQMRGFGGMICFEIEGGLEAVGQVIERLELIIHATSLGSVESLASIPVLTSHIHYSPEELKQVDVNENMIRISCGIEDSDDLIADLENALKVL